MTILERIALTKRDDIATAKREHPLAELKSQCRDLPPCRDFIAPFAGPVNGDHPKIIAEIKKASPSAGVIRADFDAVAIAKAYQRGGASALSVLTDRPYFQGELAYLTAVRAAVSLPLLRKDFTLDPYQIYEARAAGADAILLIAALLEPTQITDYLALAGELGMVALLEIHDPDDHAKVAHCRGRYLLGVNNRDLKTFSVSLDNSLNLSQIMDKSVPWISESGLKTRADLTTLSAHGFAGFLIGERLMREPDIDVALRAFMAPMT